MKKLTVLFFLCIIPFIANATISEMSFGKWNIKFDDETKRAEFVKEGVTVLKDVKIKFKNGDVLLDASSYNSVKIKQEDIVDEVGKARKFTIEYTGSENSDNPIVYQNFYLYDGQDYFLTDVILQSPDNSIISSNYIAPISTEADNLFLPADVNNRFITVPFDNDGFITYASYPLSCSQTDPESLAIGRVARDSVSMEVSAIFNGETQLGLVIGSVDHDTWKSAVRITGSPLAQGKITNLECFSGVTHHITRDMIDGVLKPHGAVKGQQVKSARMIVHYSGAWRTGLETFGDVCCAIAPKRSWDKPAPYGWSSWGGMGTEISYDGVVSVSDFIKENIQNKGGFGDDGVIFINLDASWDKLDWDELKQFVKHCEANGQMAGAYWSPFCDYAGVEDRAVEGNNGYVYGQALLKVFGKIKWEAGAACMDPTAPATLSRINFFIDKFKDAGIKCLKLDFLSNGSIEADSYRNPKVTTGIQAYNYGMKHLQERAGDDIFIIESISPLFPANYAHARRISCDAWGEMWHTSYMMNSFSFGWWLSRVYCFNDPDHLVMGDRSEAENISRMTTGAVTGYCILGDNLSTKGIAVGSKISQEKAIKFSTVEKVNDVIRLGKSFRPAYGHKLSGRNNSVDLFYLETEDSYYIAHFNYESGDKTGTIDFSYMNIDPENIDVSRSYECWTGEGVTLNEKGLEYSSPNNMAKIYRLFKK